LKYLN